MQRQFNLVYTVSAAARILGIVYGQSRITVQEWATVAWVWVKGQRPRFMSKAQFKAEFVAFRRKAAQALKVTRHLLDAHKFGVRNEAKGSLYEVEVTPTAIACQCQDYQQQLEAFGRGVCKHGFAVMNYLGYPTLAEYLQAQTS